MGHFFEQFNGSPIVFLAFANGGNRIAGAQRRRMRRGQESQGKSLKKTRVKCGSEKKCLLSVNGYDFL